MSINRFEVESKNIESYFMDWDQMYNNDLGRRLFAEIENMYLNMKA